MIVNSYKSGLLSTAGNNIERFLKGENKEADYKVVEKREIVESYPIHLSDVIPNYSENRMSKHPGNRVRSIDQSDGRLARVDGVKLLIDEDSKKTLSIIFKETCQKFPNKKLIFFSEDGSEYIQTYQEILEMAEKVLCGLRKEGLESGDRVVFQFPDNYSFIISFWACVLGGFIPAPLGLADDYSDWNTDVKKLYNIWGLLGRPYILTNQSIESSLQQLHTLWETDKLRLLNVESLKDNPREKKWVENKSEDLVLSLFTSGSTGVPKCVEHNSKSLIHMLAASSTSLRLGSKDTWLNWMPLDHVGGLIMSHLQCTFVGCHQIHPPISYFLERPTIILDWIDKYKATFAWAPNFAFSLINDQEEIIKSGNWDLSTMRCFINGADVIIAQTTQKFLKLLEPFRLTAGSLTPAFGMAELSSAMIYGRQPEFGNMQPKIHTVSQSSLDGILEHVSFSDVTATTFTEIGSPIHNVSIRIVDDNNDTLKENQIGRLQVKCPQMMAGYYKNIKANEEVFVGDGWFDTGDLGFINNEKLTITGRTKDTLIINGKNHHNYELENVAEEIQGIEVTYTAACGVYNSKTQTDDLVIFFVPIDDEFDFIINQIHEVKNHILAKTGIYTKYAIPLKKEEFYKTSLGKIQRNKFLEAFNQGAYDSILKEIDCYLIDDNRTLPSELYKPSWIESTIDTSVKHQNSSTYNLVFADKIGLYKHLPGKVIKVEYGTDFVRVNGNHFIIDPQEITHYEKVFEEVNSKQLNITHVLHLWGYDLLAKEKSINEMRINQQYNSHSILNIFKMIREFNLSNASFTVVTNNALLTSENDSLAYEKTPVSGIIKTIKHEYPNLKAKLIDFDKHDSYRHEHLLLDEYFVNSNESLVAYRNGKRKIQRITRINPVTKKQNISLKTQGLYFITGLGGITELMGEELLKNYRGKIVILGRSELSNSNNQTKYNRLAKMAETYNGEISYEVVDITNKDAVELLVSKFEAKWNTNLDGIFHFAGIIKEVELKDMSIEVLEEHFITKIYGTLALEQIVAKRDNSILVNSSSARSIHSGMTMAAYSSANEFVEMYTQYLAYQKGIQAYCFSWSMWDEIGMSKDLIIRDVLKEKGFSTITSQQGINYLIAGLRNPYPLLYIGLNQEKEDIRSITTNKASKKRIFHIFYSLEGKFEKPSKVRKRVEEFLNRSEEKKDYLIKIHLEKDLPRKNGNVDDQALYEKIDGDMNNRAYRKPATDTEKKLSFLWRELLNVNQVGVTDNFFALGGNSLNATQLVSRLNKQFNVEIKISDLFSNPTVELQGSLIDIEMNKSETQAILSSEYRGNEIPMSYTQQRQWFLYQWDPKNPYYLNTFSLRLQGRINKKAIKEALQIIIDRHDTLRSNFKVNTNNQPIQVVHPKIKMELPIIDLTHVDDGIEDAIRFISKKEATNPIDISNEPVTRANIMKVNDEEHILLITIHHIVSDGWSIGILLNELSYLYDCILNDQDIDLPLLPIKYSDFSIWQNDWIKGKEFQKQLGYWENKLSNVPKNLEFPTDYERPAIQSYHGRQMKWKINKQLTKQIYEYSSQEGTTLYMTLIGALSTLLYRYSGQEKFIIGSAVANRNKVETEGLIGFFANTLPLLFDLSKGKNFKQHVKNVKDTTLEAYENQDVPFELLIDHLKVERDPSRPSLFQTLFILQNEPLDITRLGDASASFEIEDNNSAQYDLTFHVFEAEDSLTITLDYNVDLFEESSISRLLENYQHVLHGVIKAPSVALDEISVSSKVEQELISTFSQRNKYEIKGKQTIHELFEDQVKRSPHKIACNDYGREISYQELNKRSNQLARNLIRVNHHSNTLISILVTRSIDMLIGILGSLKAGYGFLPISPSLPIERINYLLEDSKSSVLLTDSSLDVPLDYTGKVELLDEYNYKHEENKNLDLPSSKEDLLYVIYTSGTTGKPKGVEVEHKTLVNLIISQQELTSLAFERVLQFTEHSFDVCFQEIFSTLLNGGQLFIISEDDKRDVHVLNQFLNKNEIETAFLPTSYFKTISSIEEQLYEITSQLKHIVTAGEQLIVNESVKELLWKSDVQLHNHYGPSETHVVTTYTLDVNSENSIPPIGKPILNTEIYVLNSKGMEQPIGVSGEIYVGGINLARGYLDRQELTNKQFIIDPKTKKCLYKTGDIGRWLPDGNLDYIGRSDDQVKIRGYRVEIGEVEANILSINFVKEIFVMVTAVTKELYGYVVLEQGYSVDNVRENIKNVLPDYMIPAYLIQVEKFHLNANGKIDRKTLPEPTQLSISLKENTPAESDVEIKLVSIWKELLGVNQIGKKDNFFDLGGHSLKATILVTNIKSELQVNLSVKSVFAHPTIEEMAKEISSLENTDFSPIPSVDKGNNYKLSSAQKRLYAIQQQRGAELSYNMPTFIEVQGPLDKNRLEKALREIISRHETLRTTFEMVEGELVQNVHNHMIPEISKYVTADQKSINEIIDSFIRPFNLSELPLIRAGVITIDADRHLLMIDRHHIIFDGVSMNIFMNELMDLYLSRDVSELATQFKDFVVWQDNLVQEDIDKRRQYWLETFKDGIPMLQLPTDYKRPLIKSFEGKRISFEVDNELTSKLYELASKQEVTLFMVLVSAFNILMYRYTQQNDVVVGVPTNSRPHKDVESLIGMFVNTLPLRTNIKINDSFNALLRSVKKNTLSAFEHQDYPFEELLDRLDVERDLTHDPLFDVMVTLQNMDLKKKSSDELTVSPYPYDHKVSKFDLTLDAVEKGGGIFFEIEYTTKLFKQETIGKMGEHFIQLLKNIVMGPSLPISQIDILTQKEKKQILQEFNQVQKVDEITQSNSIVDIFNAKVQQFPNRTAIEYKSRTLSYKEINEKAERIASLLYNNGVSSNEVIGIMTKRSVETIIFILGTLKAGAAYLPIDPELPNDRIEYMLSNSDASQLLMNSGCNQDIEFSGKSIKICEQEIDKIQLVNREKIESKGERLAYIIYTSGSTGNPKGVKVRHSNVINTLSYLEESYPLEKNDAFLFKTNFMFDVSVTELFGWFFGEGKLVILDEEKEKDPLLMLETITQYNISHINFVPSILSTFPFDSERIKAMECLKYVFVAGESLPTSLVKRFYSSVLTVQLENLYGPTEGTIYATKYSVSDPDDSIKIGKPIKNTQAYILSETGMLQPAGSVGELCLGGEGVTDGYINNAELTKEKFVKLPQISNGYIYKTGDLAKWDENGNIEFLGRSDHQVKVRGYRIELEEIQNQLIMLEDVIDVIVVYKDEKLCAYFTARKRLNYYELYSSLHRYLPNYMIPAYFIQLEEFPLMRTGKVNRNLLPDPTKNVEASNFLEPRNDLERLLSEVWKDVLGIQHLGVRDDFLRLGGDSIKSIQVVSRFNSISDGRKISVSDILEYRTIEEIALQAKETNEQHNYQQELLEGEKELSPIEHWFFDQELSNPNHFNQSIRLKFNQTPDVGLVRSSFEHLVHHHDGLRLNAKSEKQVLFYNKKHVSKRFELLNVDVSNGNITENVKRVEKRIKTSFNIEEDLLIKAVILNFGDNKYELLITAHHLIVDGVTWRILVNDLVRIYTSLQLGQSVELPPKTASQKDWYQYLLQQEKEGVFNNEKYFWQEVDDHQFSLLLDEENDEWSVENQQVIKKSLNSKNTNLLKTTVHQAFNTEINDILLTALSLTVEETMGLNQLVVTLEKHGRHSEKIDLSRTTGWFTAMYPILLALPNMDLRGQIKGIKEQIRKVPNDGIGYGILKYLKDRPLKEPFNLSEIRFNYLGQFDNEIDNDLFTFSKMSGEGEISPSNNMSAKLDINCFIVHGRMHFEITYNSLAFYEKNMKKFADKYMEYLERIIDFTVNRDEPEFTASDFSYADISQDILDEILE